MIKNAKYEIKQIDNIIGSDDVVLCGAISNNLKFIVSGYRSD